MGETVKVRRYARAPTSSSDALVTNSQSPPSASRTRHRIPRPPQSFRRPRAATRRTHASKMQEAVKTLDDGQAFKIVSTSDDEDVAVESASSGNESHAGVAELADAQDLKSWAARAACGFDSRPPPQFQSIPPSPASHSRP